MLTHFQLWFFGGGFLGPLGCSGGGDAHARATAAFDGAVWEENGLPNAAVATLLSR